MNRAHVAHVAVACSPALIALVLFTGCYEQHYPATLIPTWTITDSAGTPVGCGDASTVRYSAGTLWFQDVNCYPGTGTIDMDASPDLVVTPSLLDIYQDTIMTAPPQDVGPVDWGDVVRPPATVFVLPDCAPGQFTAAWSLVTPDGQPTSCPPGASVLLSVETMAVQVPCTAGTATTVPRRGGMTHPLAIQLRDSSGLILSQLQLGKPFVACGATTDIGVVSLSVAP
jgi:hypothetical protein